MMHLPALLLGQPPCTDCDDFGAAPLLGVFKMFCRFAGGFICVGMVLQLVMKWRHGAGRIVPAGFGCLLGCFLALSTALQDQAFSRALEFFFVLFVLSSAVLIAFGTAHITNRALHYFKTKLHKDSL